MLGDSDCVKKLFRTIYNYNLPSSLFSIYHKVSFSCELRIYLEHAVYYFSVFTIMLYFYEMLHTFVCLLYCFTRTDRIFMDENSILKTDRLLVSHTVSKTILLFVLLPKPLDQNRIFDVPEY